jgi:S-layer-related duplication domain
MQLKHLLVALVLLLAFVGPAVAADSVEIRSELIDATSITGPTLVLDATKWAGFYYNLNSGVSTEEIWMDVDASGDLVITYITKPEFQEYDYDFGVYNAGTVATPINHNLGFAIIGFFAEPYVALGKANTNNNTTLVSGVPAGLDGIKANKIAKLVLDTDERYLLKTGSTLELGEGYSIIVDQIDVDGNKAYIKFMKDGRELNSSIVSTATGETGDWVFDLTVLSEKNIQVMRLHVSSVFQGTQDSLVEIRGLWLVDYLNAIEVKTDVDYGKWEAKTASTTELVYETDGISLNADEDLNLGKGIYVKTGKEFANSTHSMENMFYLYKEYTDAGTYEIRSSVVSMGASSFDFTNFAAFYFDIDTGVQTETLDVTVNSTGRYDLEYITAPVDVKYDFTGTTIWDTSYYVMGLFGEKYVPLNIVNSTGVVPTGSFKADKIAELVVDSDERYLLKTGATLELGSGYTLVVDQIDVDGNKAYMKFMKDGREINSSIVTTGAAATTDSSWIFDTTVLNEKNTQVLRVHVKSVFQGTQDSLVEIDALWLMDYQNARELKTDDKFGLMEYKGSGRFLADDVALSADDDKVIANNMSVKVSDTAARYYFYVEAVVGEGSTGPTQPDIPDVPDVTTPPTTPDTPDEKPDVVTPPIVEDKDDEKGWFAKNWMYILAAIVLIIIIAGVAYYFLVMKKQ